MQESHDTVDLRWILRGLRRRWHWIVASMIVFGGGMYAIAELQAPRYEAVARLLLVDPELDQVLPDAGVADSSADPLREARTNVQLISLDVVAARAAESLPDGAIGPMAIQDQIAVALQGNSNLVSIIAEDSRRRFAAELANAVAAAYIDFRQDADRERLKAQIRLLERELRQLPKDARDGQEGQELERQISALKTLRSVQTGNAELVAPATPPENPVAPRPRRNAALGVVFGLLIGLSSALLAERLDRRLRTPEEVEEQTGLPVLASVPETRSLQARGPVDVEPAPRLRQVQSFQNLLGRLRYLDVDRPVKSLLVTSTLPREGKSTVSIQAARAAAALGLRTVLIETDMSDIEVIRTLGARPLPGLSDLLTDQASVDDVVQQVAVPTGGGDNDGQKLDVITGGLKPPKPLELVANEAMADLLKRMEESYDLVLLDSPPVGSVVDAMPLVARVGGVMIVARAGQVERDDLLRLHAELDELGANVVGVVLNRLKMRGDSWRPLRRARRWLGAPFGWAWRHRPRSFPRLRRPRRQAAP